MKIILFDIDRTLVHVPKVRNIMSMAFKKVFCIKDAFKDISISGKTDTFSLKEALEIYGIENNTDKLKKYKKYLIIFLRKLFENDSSENIVLPGVKELLESLHIRKDARLGLLTGNWKKSAYIKLDHFGLSKYFKFGAFADDAMLRDDLLPFALKRCGAKTSIDLKNVIIIGDTPLDIRCAKVHGAKALGVATGRYSKKDLLKEGADLVLEDLSETENIISWIFTDKF
jgi:phosphoglycolate phosphatase-like HAD superfamily hydrolase